MASSSFFKRRYNEGEMHVSILGLFIRKKRAKRMVVIEQVERAQ
jgi:hypothetical protein